MPRRTIPLATGQIYHMINRGVNYQLIFHDRRDYQRALDVVQFYQYAHPPVKFSTFKKLSLQERKRILEKLALEDNKLVTFIAFCFMPNHFHFLVRQEMEHGISIFLANFQNSYTKYYNKRHNRSGHLLQGQFRSVRIVNEYQLLHTSRYIHLNPYTGYAVKTIADLLTYPWSSLREYTESADMVLCDTSIVLAHFQARSNYVTFVLDQKDYQRTLDEIKHLLLEEQ